jgi:transcriptional regulator with XRE-family HTH domain
MIATHLKRIRLSQALSMRDLSRRSGVSPATMVRAERGEPVYPTTVRRLAKALGVTPAELAELPAPPVPGVRRIPRSTAQTEPPGLAPLLERAEHFRLMGNLAEAARWQRLADQLLAESGSVE